MGFQYCNNLFMLKFKCTEVFVSCYHNSFILYIDNEWLIQNLNLYTMYVQNIY